MLSSLRLTVFVRRLKIYKVLHCKAEISSKYLVTDFLKPIYGVFPSILTYRSRLPVQVPSVEESL